VKITVRYQTQIKRAVGLVSETVDIGPSCAVPELLRQLAQRHGESFRRLVLKDTGMPHDSILMFVGDRQLTAEAGQVWLHDGDVLTLLAPMAGG